ncbi:pyridoxamine 5'-phosphate oxidase family protein [Mycolicibacterium grossiae]|uniref:Flavin-nucleotide-binding protein n=1 Tax=Mycolicibacterium grossiae TaxID=1552759 RepID=A0A1E8PZP4_9MYCO|nr:pyridoxamine 5'-phosphate oxidase family protein [Mycolicibacterium grossiae]OFJ51733.1 flavin-nucleotide-binding protein [Mycolicibacterium grossiae]QEM47647.1 pyridoxamine 5'-phosphate oxidase family protein [Mycolicibacterium grossiae]
MTTPQVPPTRPTTDVTRLPEKQTGDRAALDALLASTPLATVAMVRDGHPVVFPTGFARVADEFVIHGSTGSPWLRALAAGAPVAVSVTTLDGVVVARSSFESSFHYRSAVLFGSFAVVPDAEKVRYLDALTDAFIPHRVAELRASTRKELAATLALRMPIADGAWSLKVSAGWPDDPESDVAGEAWAGVVPMHVRYGVPRPAPDLRPGIAVPDSVRTLAEGSVQ